MPGAWNAGPQWTIGAERLGGRAGGHKATWRFVENRGQWDSRALYAGIWDGVAAWLTRDGLRLEAALQSSERQVNRVVIGLKYENGDPHAIVRGENRLRGEFNYFLGNDPTYWQTGVPAYEAVVYRNLYPGVDVRVRGLEGCIEYDVVLAPGADLESVVISCEGTESLTIGRDGTLVLGTALGPIRQQRPTTWQCLPTGEQQLVTCNYRILDGNRFGFEVPRWNSGLALVIDPGLEWSSGLGGSSNDKVTGLAVDSAGATIVSGWTESVDFPTTVGSFSSGPLGHSDSFVTAFDGSGQFLIYSTYFGGGFLDQALCLTLDDAGGPVIAGTTSSLDFPATAGAYSTTVSGLEDVFVARFDPTGSRLVFASLLGGPGSSGVEFASAIAISHEDVITVAGGTEDPGFPVTLGAFQAGPSGSVGGVRDGFVTRFAADGSSLLYSTYLAGMGADNVTGLVVDDLGQATVTGRASDGFPVSAGALKTVPDPLFSDAMVARLSADGSELVYSTYLGGSNEDKAFGIAEADSGEVVVVGWTRSEDFPVTSGAWDTVINNGAGGGSADAFVCRLNATGESLVYSTFVGGGGVETNPMAVVVDSAGAITIAGRTVSNTYPTTAGAFATEIGGGVIGNWDAFVTRLHPSGRSLLYSTYLGGSGHELNAGDVRLALDQMGAVVVAGAIGTSNDFPVTSGAFDPNPEPGDIFVTKVEMLATGVSRFGIPTPGCQGPMAIGAHIMPTVGATDFALTCTNAPPRAQGLLALATGALARPVTVAGIELWLDPSRLALLIGQTSDDAGYSEMRLPIPTDPALMNLTFYAQYVWPDSCNSSSLAASNALSVTIQP